MISSIVYGLHDMFVERPGVTLAATGIFGFSKNRFITNLRYGLARVILYSAERAVIDGGGIGKMLWKDLTLPKGAARAPIWGTSASKAVVDAARTKARSQLARGGALAIRGGKFLLSAPARPYLIVGAATIAAGYAVGRTKGVRTAPPINTRFVMGAPM